jgi:hypothetical protein
MVMVVPVPEILQCPDAANELQACCGLLNDRRYQIVSSVPDLGSEDHCFKVRSMYLKL